MSEAFLQKTGPVLAFLRRVLAVRFVKAPIASPEQLADFIESRAAYIGQTSLYGYLKARMGTRFPEMFTHAVFSESINLAKWRIYAACLADLSVFTAAAAAAGGNLRDEEAAALARHCFSTVVGRNYLTKDVQAIAGEAGAAFEQRLAQVNWREAAHGETAFSDSPAALVRWAPIADELKRFDTEIIVNSIRFRWRDIREQMRRRLDAPAIGAAWRARSR